jgi:hypothetical protein
MDIDDLKAAIENGRSIEEAEFLPGRKHRGRQAQMR